MEVKPLPFPSWGVDCLTVLDAIRARGLKEAGASFAIRYLGDIGPSERDTILSEGLGLSLVTFGHGSSYDYNGPSGTIEGQNDSKHLDILVIPKGATVWIDLEGVGPQNSWCCVYEWINARAQVLYDNGYDVGLYVGANQPLSADQLWVLPRIHKYWRSLSRVPEPPCGFCLSQAYRTTVIAGTSVDVDYVQYDYKSRLPMGIYA